MGHGLGEWGTTYYCDLMLIYVHGTPLRLHNSCLLVWRLLIVEGDDRSTQHRASGPLGSIPTW